MPALPGRWRPRPGAVVLSLGTAAVAVPDLVVKSLLSLLAAPGWRWPAEGWLTAWITWATTGT